MGLRYCVAAEPAAAFSIRDTIVLRSSGEDIERNFTPLMLRASRTRVDTTIGAGPAPEVSHGGAVCSSLTGSIFGL
jgi:hypothetical protein